MQQRAVRRLAVVLAFSAHVVGYLGPAGGQGGRPAAASVGFVDPVVVTGTDVAEPGIDIASDGTIYLNSPGGLNPGQPGSVSEVYRSDDGGVTWVRTPPGLRALFPGGGDSDLAVDPGTGNLSFSDLWLGSATVARSTDRGQTWVVNPVQGVILQDRQWLAAPGGDVVYHVTHQLPVGLVVSKSFDGGLTYPVHSVAATVADQTGCICPPGTLVAERGVGGVLGSGDKVGVIYPTSIGGVKFARSETGGLLFATSDVSPPGEGDVAGFLGFPVVVNAGGGRLVAVWLEVGGGRSAVRMSRSSDWGTTWEAPRSLVEAGTPVYPWVDARGPKVAVSLYHTDAGGTPGTVPEEATWYERYLESNDGGETFSPLVTVDPVPVKSGPICTEGAGCAGDRELLDFQSVAIDAAGRANLAWTRSVDNVEDTEIRFTRQAGS